MDPQLAMQLPKLITSTCKSFRGMAAKICCPISQRVPAKMMLQVTMLGSRPPPTKNKRKQPLMLLTYSIQALEVGLRPPREANAMLQPRRTRQTWPLGLAVAR